METDSDYDDDSHKGEKGTLPHMVIVALYSCAGLFVDDTEKKT